MPSLRRLLLPFVVAFGVLLWPTVAAASLRVKWDCYLPSASVDCVILEASLTSKIPFVKVVSDARAADVFVSVTSVPAEDGTRYKFDFVGKRVDGYVAEVHTTDRIPSSIDGTTAMVRLMTKLQRGLDDFMDQKVAAEVKDGALTLTLLDPVRLPFTGRPEQDGLKWYVAPSVGTYFSDVQGVGVNGSGTAAIAYNYSAKRWRVEQSMSISYSRQSQPVPGTGETASIDFTGGNAMNVLSRSLGDGGHWNAGVLLSIEKNPQANYAVRANGSVGIEFDLVPRQTVNQKNFGFRCAVGPELQRYDEVNEEGVNQQLVARQFCDVFLGWHFQPVDVWATLGETTILESFDYRAVSVGFSATWRLTDNLQLAPWINLQGIDKAIDEPQPTTAVLADPRQEIEASMLAAVQQAYTSPFGVQTGLSLKYLFGNGSLASEDQRWKGVSNLR